MNQGDTNMNNNQGSGAVGLVGWTGLVGQTLFPPLHSKYGQRLTCWNRANLEGIRGQVFDVLYLACLPANKWWANQNPDADLANLDHLLKHLAEVKADRVILVSTVDVLQQGLGQDETGSRWADHPYGIHRRALEVWASQRVDAGAWNSLHIVRLPGLFGRGLKKNVLYDLLHDRSDQLITVHPDSEFQWFDLDALWGFLHPSSDTSTTVTIRNIVSEPIKVREIVDTLKFEYKVYKIDYFNPNIVQYDTASVEGVWCSKQEVLERIATWFAAEQAFMERPFRLAASNIGFDVSDTMDGLLRSAGIDCMEVALNKPALPRWPVASMQSILWHTDLQIFHTQENIQQFFLHYTRVVLPQAVELGVKAIVFGCPRQRSWGPTTRWVDCVALFRRLGDVSKAAGVLLCVEANAPAYGCTWLTDLESVLDFLSDVNHPNIRLNLDSGNYAMAADTFPIERIPVNIVGHIQLSAAFLGNTFGAAERLVAERVLRYAWKTGYAGVISYEARKPERLEEYVAGLHEFTDIVFKKEEGLKVYLHHTK